jgi:hypothetical protein
MNPVNHKIITGVLTNNQIFPFIFTHKVNYDFSIRSYSGLSGFIN